jgi:YD repeat-containing protein
VSQDRRLSVRSLLALSATGHTAQQFIPNYRTRYCASGKATSLVRRSTQRPLAATSCVIGRRTIGRLVALMICGTGVAQASTVATPTFSPAAGTYTSVQTVTISDSTSGATIYYTTNGSTPTTSSTEYTEPITVSSSETVKAIGTKSGYTESSVGSAAYTINLTTATPSFSPTAGTYTSAQTVTISDSTSGATIYYTTNGTTPTTSSTQYTTPIAVSTSETVKAVATASGYAESAVGSAAYTINLTAATPTFSPSAGTYTSAQTVTISDSTSGSTIYYTTNGTTPTTSSPVYSSAINVSATETIEAIATATGYAQSATASATYTIAAPAPTFSPGAGTYGYGYGGNAVTVTISDAAPGATIYYTLTNGTSGTTPTTSSTVYSGPIGVGGGGTQTLEAIAVVSGYSNSSVTTAVYTIDTPPPSISLAAGSYVGSQTVTLSDVISNRATIYYTTNGTTPTTSSTRYNGAITVSSSETLQAIATYSGFGTSPVSSAVYTITSVPATPTIAPAGGSYGASQLVTISDSSLNATVYYTVTGGTTGTTPTTSSSVYNGAITADATETIEAIAVSGSSSSSVATATYTLAAPASSETALTVTSGGNPVTSVVSGSVVTLTASVTSGGNDVTIGTVNFCVAAATSCTDVHLLGTAQLTSAGTATISFRPGGGTHSYTAVFAGTATISGSSSSSASLSVTGIPTTASISASGTGPAYTLTATVTGTGSDLTPPTGTVSFLDASNGNTSVATASLSGTGTSQSFANSTILSASGLSGLYPSVVVTADFNGDGKPDLAVIQYHSEDLLIELGNGDGTFTAGSGSPVSLGCSSQSMVTGDFNGDGKPDLAIACGDSVTVLLGNGDGTFTQASGSPFSLPENNPVALAVGDFNQDGKLDLAVASSECCSDNDLTIMLGNGNGTFVQASGSPLTIGPDPDFVVVGDFNGDGIADLAVGDEDNSTITVFLGSGNGTFAEASGGPITTPDGFPIDIVSGDFNGDGKADLAVALYDYGIMVLLSNGDGTFTQPSGSPFAVSAGAAAVAVGDFNGDGVADLAVASLSQNQIVLLQGNGSGTFVENATFSVGDYPESIAVADFNGDGVVDMAVANYLDLDVSVWLTDLATTATATATGVSVVGTGTHSVDASYGGDSSYTASVSSTTPLTAVIDEITNVSPGTGYAGTSITITGAGFGVSQGSSVVIIGGVAASVSSWSNTQIQAQIPNGPGPGPQSVVVIVGGSQGTPGAVTVIPAIALVTPSTGFAGSYVVVEGSNFGPLLSGASSVSFNGLSAQIAYWTTSGIGVSLPNGVSTGPVVVTACNASGSWCGTSNSANFTVPTGPTILSLSPASGAIGSTITVSGQNFGTSGSVTFNGVTATPTSWGIDTIVTPVPAGASTGPIVVTTGSTSSNGFNFTVSGGITGISPVQGVAGTSVTITGTGFGSSQGSNTVTFNGLAATVSNWSNTGITVLAPSGGTTGAVAIQLNGISSIGQTFTFVPVISNLSPSSGPAGTSVTIAGSNFGASQGTSSVSFGQIVGAPAQWSQNSITVPVPPNAATGPVTIVVAGQTSNAVTFTVGTGSGAGSVNGTITQTDGVTPISGASVTLLNGTTTVASLTTSSSGSYSINNLAAGGYSLQASAFGFGAGSQSGVSVAAGAATVVNLSLGAQTVITYSYDAAGRLVGVASPAQGAAAYTYDPVGNILSINRIGAGQVSILSFTPASGPVGTIVTISGTSFSGNPQQNTVTFGGVAATVLSSSTTQLVVSVPIGAVTGAIGVTSPSGGATSSSVFTVGQPAGAPTITSFSPNVGNAGTAVTISGSSFDVAANDQTAFNGTLASVTSAAPTSIVATVPAAATSGAITVTTPEGSSTSSGIFFVVPAGYTTNQIDFTGQVTPGGSPYTGTINNAGDLGIVVFSATAGQPLSLTISSSSLSDAIVSILDPSGSSIESESIGNGQSLLDTVNAPVSGTYTILVQSAGATGSLTLSLAQTSTQTGGPNTSQTEEVNIAGAGQSATVTFNGTAGQIVSVAVENTTFPGFGISGGVSILNPNETTLTSGGMVGQGNFLYGPVALPSTGTYSVVITPSNGGGSATVLVSLFQNRAISVTAVNGGTASTPVSINIPGQEALLTFSGTAGQVASVVLNDSTFTGGGNNVAVRILNPDGSTLLSGTTQYQGSFIFGPATLPSTGNYTIVISPGINSGGANVLLSLFANQTGSLVSGTPDNVTITIPGQEALLTFSGTSGQSATVQMNNSTFTGGAYNVGVTILNPDGSTLFSGSTMYQGNFTFGSVSLGQNGSYTLVIAPGINSGSAIVTLTLQ